MLCRLMRCNAISYSPLLRTGSLSAAKEGSMHSSYLSGNSGYSYRHDSMVVKPPFAARNKCNSSAV